MDYEIVPAKCPYCGYGSARVERNMEGFCQCDRCRLTFIDKTIPLKLTIRDLNKEIDSLHREIAELRRGEGAAE